MKKLAACLAVSALVGGFGFGAPAHADPYGTTVTVCGDTSCDVYDCPAGADTLDPESPSSGCTLQYSYPREREVSEG